MTDAPENLRPASTDDVTSALAYALRFDGRKRTHTGDELMAIITAQRLAAYLQLAGFVVLKKPPIGPNTSP